MSIVVDASLVVALLVADERHATDSTYIRLAQRLGATVWTLDGAIARNAADLGLPVELVT
ncbi:MAG: hypothetical protein ACRCSN_09250 [Dermatophilaceae bacterium]